MKKMLHGILLIALFFSFAVCVHADLLATPHENDFFMAHEDKMENGSNYYLKAEKKTPIYESPASDKIVGNLEKGRVIQLHYIYTDENGVKWGAQVISDELCAWVKMEDMSEFYWFVNFYMDHEEEMYSSGNRKIHYKENGWLVLWEYPGSDMISGAIKTSDTRNSEFPVRGGWQYTDQQGTDWIHVNYRGAEGWLNTKEPLSRSKPAVMDVIIGRNELSKNSNFLIAGFAIIVCGLTGVLFALKKKRN